MGNVAYYRLPYSDVYVRIETDRKAQIVRSMEELADRSGFLIMPFAITDDCPAVLIAADRVTTEAVVAKEEKRISSNETSQSATHEYETDFKAFHDAIRAGRFAKLVLSRKKEITRTVTCDAEKFFFRACRMYPRLMVMLFHTEQTGTWLVASPEILIEGEREAYHTVALAGTMLYSEGYADWSDKNKREQHIVDQYIENVLRRYCSGIVKDGPVSMRAGDLMHLRTDFRFTLKSDARLPMLVAALHPTPAVCGLPKQEAYDFIMQSENCERRYYSGFAGPYQLNDETHLYVSLRCAELRHDTAVLYAGGGIMPDSCCKSEWQETEQKMQTMHSVLL